jgi:DNA gyrase subunit A
MGVKFVTPKEGDAVAVVARSVEAKVDEEVAGEADGDTPTGPEGESEDSSATDPAGTIDQTVPEEAAPDEGESDS